MTVPSATPRPVLRVLWCLAAGAVAGAAMLAGAYVMHPGFTLEMDRTAAGVLTGFHAGERAGDQTFAWSQRQASLRLPDLDRRGAWTCTIRLSGGRADPASLPEVILAVDGIVATRFRTTNEPSDILIPLAPRSSAGAVLTLTTETFVPGGGDSRELGVSVDRWGCAPESGWTPLPPGPAIRAAAIAAAAFGGALALLGAPVVTTGTGILALAGLQTVPLVRDLGPFSAFALPIDGLAVSLILIVLAVMLGLRVMTGRLMSTAGRFALLATTFMLYLKWLALFHPSKLVVDALFHAHRLEWVLDGRYFFTQLMPSGVQFPYAIGLYVFAMPWTFFTSDYVSLLRIIVTAAEAAGGLLLYHLVARSWGDRPVAAMAAVLYALVPRTFEIVGNANMTNAFAQSVALATLVAATLWPLSREHWKAWIGLTLLMAFALLSHISTLTLLSAILLALAALYWLFGRPPLRREAWAIALALTCAVALSTVLYYRHFADAFRSAARVRGESAADAVAAATPLMTRGWEVARFSLDSVGWPLVLLAIPGAVWWTRRGWRDRLGLAIAALALTFAVLTLSVAVVPVGQSFHRYAVEFISRVTLATYPALIIWAALGALGTWRAGGLARVGGVLLVAAALATAGDAWLEWIR